VRSDREKEPVTDYGTDTPLIVTDLLNRSREFSFDFQPKKASTFWWSYGVINNLNTVYLGSLNADRVLCLFSHQSIYISQQL
jgi:hypothetical protein